jgi:hypothetical protein
VFRVIKHCSNLIASLNQIWLLLLILFEEQIHQLWIIHPRYFLLISIGDKITATHMQQKSTSSFWHQNYTKSSWICKDYVINHSKNQLNSVCVVNHYFFKDLTSRQDRIERIVRFYTLELRHIYSSWDIIRNHLDTIMLIHAWKCCAYMTCCKTNVMMHKYFKRIHI